MRAPPWGFVPVAAGGIAEEPRAVELVGRAVVAQFVEGAEAHKEAQRSGDVLGQEHRVLAMDVAGDIDGAALEGRLLDVAIGAEHARCGEHAPWAKFGLRERAGVVGAFSAVSGGELGASSAVGRTGTTLMTPPMALEP